MTVNFYVMISRNVFTNGKLDCWLKLAAKVISSVYSTTPFILKISDYLVLPGRRFTEPSLRVTTHFQTTPFEVLTQKITILVVSPAWRTYARYKGPPLGGGRAPRHRLVREARGRVIMALTIS